MNELNDDEFKSIKYLFAKPYYNGDYLYSINELENMMIIDKTSLKEFLFKLKCLDFSKLNYLLDRNLPLLFTCKDKKLKTFNSPSLTEKDVSQNILNELKLNNNQPKSAFDYYFGKDSNFYNTDIYSERLKQWQS